MDNILFRKGIVYTVILLFICTSIIQSTGIKIVNKSNNELYSENSTICGFMTDFETGEPIYYAIIEFWVFDDQGNDYGYESISDLDGFYIIENVASGHCLEYGANADGYHFYWDGNFNIGENETVWVNMSMYPVQPITSQVCGYVYDNHTGEPIFDSHVYMHWFDKYYMLTYGGDRTDETGFYSINIGAGSFDVYTNTVGYVDYWRGRYNISDYETMWVNFSLDPEVIIKIISPQDGVYYKNKMIFPFRFPLIIGQVDIKFNVTLYDDQPIDHVEIIIDNVSKKTFTSEPYIYNWSEITLLKFRHTIEIIVQPSYFLEASMKFDVWKFF